MVWTSPPETLLADRLPGAHDRCAVLVAGDGVDAARVLLCALPSAGGVGAVAGVPGVVQDRVQRGGPPRESRRDRFLGRTLGAAAGVAFEVKDMGVARCGRYRWHAGEILAVEGAGDVPQGVFLVDGLVDGPHGRGLVLDDVAVLCVAQWPDT